MIVIEGVVGAGKSTLMRLLAGKGYTPFPEPVMDAPLDEYYKNPKRYAFQTQLFFMNRRYQQMREAAKVDLSVLDRSIYGDGVIARMHYEAGNMTREQYNIYRDIQKSLLESCPVPSLLVYLEVNVDEEIRRINMRGRSAEKVVPRDYWERMVAYYDELVDSYAFSPVLRIDANNKDFADNPQDQAEIWKLIKEKTK